MNVRERRRKPRIAASDIGMRLDGQSAPARVRDISASGVRCITDIAFSEMTQVQLVLVIPGRSGDTHEITCRGTVVRCQPCDAASEDASAVRAEHADTAAARGRRSKFDTAIFFSDMRDSDRIDVEQMVSAALRQGT